MASTKSMKGGKFKFKKKDGTWSKKSFTSKTAAMSARRGSRGGGGGKSQPSGNGSNKPGWGRWARMARTIDVVSAPAQGSLSNEGMTKEAALDAATRYTTYPNDPGNWGTVVTTGEAIGTGLGRDWVRSKMGVYRGVGQKKFLSFVMAGNPELLAYVEADPLTSPRMYNAARNQYDRAYNPITHTWSTSPSTSKGQRFWRSIGMDVALRAIQHLLFDTTGPVGLNRFLGKGVNA